MKHTPGPWKIDPVLVEGVPQMIFSESDNSLVCIQPEKEYAQGHAAWDANAPLIAAAPELLRLCEGIVMFPDVKQHLMQKFPGLFLQIEQAVAQAKGES